MSRDHLAIRAINRISRRRVLTVAAVGAGVSAAGVAGLSFARENDDAADDDNSPLVLSLRDASSGTFDLFVGGSRIRVKDPKLARHLRKLARRR